MEELKEILARLERIEKLLQEKHSDEYSVEELFQYVLDRLLKDYALFPEELKFLWIPLESFERLLMEKVVYRDDAKRYVKKMVKQGFIEYHSVLYEDYMGNSVEIPTVIISNEKIPTEMNEEVVMRRVSYFYNAYQQKYKRPIKPGTELRNGEWEKIEAASRKTLLFGILKPLRDKKIIFTEQDWIEFYQDITSEMPLWNIMERMGIIETIADKDGFIEGARFLVTENEAYQLIRKFFGNKGNS